MIGTQHRPQPTAATVAVALGAGLACGPVGAILTPVIQEKTPPELRERLFGKSVRGTLRLADWL
jgi:hypothetical protein